ncbi:MAG: hypothetical protein SNJ52_05770, partial [Verrucomicrobiia bacterium]
DNNFVPPHEELHPPIFMLSDNGAALTIQRSDLQPTAKLQFPVASGMEIYAGPIEGQQGMISLTIPMADGSEEAGIVVEIEHDPTMSRATLRARAFGNLPNGQPIPVRYSGGEFQTVSAEAFLAFARGEATRAEEHLRRVIAECETHRALWTPSFSRTMELQPDWEANTAARIGYILGLTTANAASAP